MIYLLILTLAYAGVKYREVRFEGRNYYLRFLGREDQAEVNCALESKNLPPLAQAGVTAYKRYKIFMESIKETCETLPKSGGRTRRILDFEPRIGIAIPDSANSPLTEKKIFVAPRGLSFSGEW